jgi:hypothetical protein
MISVPISGAKSMVYDKIPYSDSINYYRTDFDVIKFEIEITTTTGEWTENQKADVYKWLNRRTPQKFQTSDDLNKHIYCVCDNAMNLTTSTFTNGYIKLNFTATTPYWLGAKVTNAFNIISSPTTVQVINTNQVMHPKYNQYWFFPKITIALGVGVTSVTLTNLSNSNRVTSFTNVNSGITIQMFNDKQKIITSDNSNIISKFNKNWFYLVEGTNNIQITGLCTVTFEMIPNVFL